MTSSNTAKTALAPDPENIDGRSLRAWTEQMAVTPLGGGIYRVESESGNEYRVDLPGGRCTCPDHRYRGGRCKHRRRVAIEVTTGRTPPPGKRRADCAVCGHETFADETARLPLCDDCTLEHGAAVRDRETGDLLVVVDVLDVRADEAEIPGHDCTVATYPDNDAYPAADPVVRAVYVGDATRSGDPRRYSFPHSRLEPTAVDLPRSLV
jgi:hypothetical protein